MGKLAAAKKKGRPRKKRRARRVGTADLSSRRPPPSPASSIRRRRRDYDEDDDVALEEEEEEEEDEEREEREEMERKRKAKKLKLVLKLPHHVPTRICGAGGGHVASAAAATAASSSSSEESFLEEEEEEDDEEYRSPRIRLKKRGRRRRRRRIDGRDGRVYDDDGARSDGSGSAREGLQDGIKNVVSRCNGSVSGSVPSCSPLASSLPDEKTLESILDKLQKKDTYGVYAEPVDSEELPDYHDVIEHPMDFGTMRKKLRNNAYATLEQFENDVFLICTNAMQYNGPETVYFRQARSIQHLARNKFQMLRVEIKQKIQTSRVDNECVDTGVKSEQRTRSNSVAKKPIKKSSGKHAQEPAGSDISSAATLASTGDTCTVVNHTDNCTVANHTDNCTVANHTDKCTVVNHTQDGAVERSANLEGLIEDNSVLCDSKPEKVEELPAKCLPAKHGRKPYVVDENRRATYLISNEDPLIQSDSVSTIFEIEKKQLDAVGLHAEHAYARSLARFAANLGPVAWRIASKKIEAALPAGVKFGCGWVGEYEPLPTPVLSLENYSQRRPNYGQNLQSGTDFRKDKETVEWSNATQNGVAKNVQLGSLLNSSASGVFSRTSDSRKEKSLHEATNKQKLGMFGAGSGTSPVINSPFFQQQKNLLVDEFSKVHANAKAYSNASPRVRESNSSSCSSSPVGISLRRPDFCSEVTTSRSGDTVARNTNNLHAEPLKQSETGPAGPTKFGIGNSGLEAGKNAWNSGGIRPTTPLDLISTGGTSYCFTRGGHKQIVDDPVEVMRMLSGKVPNEPSSGISLQVMDSPKQVTAPVLPPRDISITAATAAARAWMSIGSAAVQKSTESSSIPRIQVEAASLFNPSWESPTSDSRSHVDVKRRPVSEQVWVQSRGLDGFPQFIATDLGRFQGQTPWRGLVPHVQKPKKDMLPPDLNIGYQSPQSPVTRSSSLLVDSQQPDLALQL